MTETKVVKRYANRKLYDTERSCYVTLDDIAAMIRAGEELQVIDNKSGEDLTSVTFAQIIFETEKKSNFMPLSLLKQLIQDGGDAIGGLARDGVDKVHAKASDLRETAQKLGRETAERIRIGRPTTVRSFADLVGASQRAFDELQHSIEEKLRGTGRNSLGAEVEEIRKRLADLEQRLGQLAE